MLYAGVNLSLTSTIVEISRLRNSIDHLKATQMDLDDFLTSDDAEDDDGELRRAYDENVAVMCVFRTSYPTGVTILIYNLQSLTNGENRVDQSGPCGKARVRLGETTLRAR